MRTETAPLPYDYESSPQGVAFNPDERNPNLLFLFDRVDRLLSSKGTVRILEIGAGGGRNLQALRHRFRERVELFGTDISSAALAHAESLKIGRFVQARSDVIPFEERFDLILMVDILEHLDRPADVVSTLDNALDRLAAGGALYVSVPVELNRFSLTWFFSKLPALRDLTRLFYGHLIQFTPGSFRALIDGKRMRVMETFYSVHAFTQVQVLFFFYAPKVLLRLVLGKRAANDLRDSNEIVGGSAGPGFLSIVKKAFVALSAPMAYLGFMESRRRMRSPFAAGNMHLLLERSSTEG